MRKYNLLLAFFLSISMYVLAQPVSKTEPAGPKKPDGYTKTTTVSTDESLRRVVVIEIKNEHGQLECRTTWTKSLDGKLTKSIELFTDSGKRYILLTFYLNGKGELQTTETTIEDGKKGTETRDAQGGMSDENGQTKFPETVKKMEAELIEDFEKIEAQNFAALQGACPPGGCTSKIDLFGGYSYLSSDFGNETESLHGAGVSALFNFNDHIGAGINASVHTKKFGDENLVRIFVLGEGRYTFNINNCNNVFIPNLHVVGGICTESYGNSNGSGFAFGAGGGISIRISNKIGASLNADWLGVKFKNSDDINSNVRVSAGISIWAGQRFYRRKDVHISDFFFFNKFGQGAK